MLRFSRYVSLRPYNLRVPKESSMFISYEDAVLEVADENDNLSLKYATKLLADHGFTMDDVYADPGDVSPIALDERNAYALLNWLGY